jgi:lipopolysaccharide export LptBFGC system permease protein LptF
MGMAINWVTLLAAVPWTEVIKNAPKVADSAKKLWHSVGGKDGKLKTTRVATASGPTARLEALEATVDELNRQMQASAELIKALADQNTQLVQRIELNRRRTLYLSIIVLVLVAVLVFKGLG